MVIIGPPGKRHLHGINMAFRWRANGGPFLVIFGSSLIPLTTKQNIVRIGPRLTKLSGPSHEVNTYIGLSGLAGFG